MDRNPRVVKTRRASTRSRAWHLAGRREEGSQGIQMAAMVAPCLLLLMVGVAIHRAAADNLAVDTAAYDAARAASIARTAGQAQASGQAAADASLAQSGLVCADRTVALNLSGFDVPVGQPATVSATVSCTATTAGMPWVTGGRSFTSTAVSPLDSYRERQ